MNAGSKRLLKADAARGLGANVAFNYDDFRQRCDEYLENIRTQSQQMIEDAERDAQARARQIFEDAEKNGRAEGLRHAGGDIAKKAESLASQMVSKQIETALPALQRAAEALGIERDRWIAQWETSALQLSVAIAEKIIRRELKTNPHITRDIIIEVLHLVSGNSHIKLRLHPGDLDVLGAEINRILETSVSTAHATIIADDSMTPGGCIAETQYGTVDARLETQLERIAEELSL